MFDLVFETGQIICVSLQPIVCRYSTAGTGIPFLDPRINFSGLLSVRKVISFPKTY